jgi:hypothetical protein
LKRREPNLTQKYQIIKDEIEKQFQLRKWLEQLKIIIKRMKIIFDIKLKC